MLTPHLECCDAGNRDRKCTADRFEWETDEWEAIDFEISSSHYFQYSYQSDGKTFTAQAVGDLDCDGVPVEYTLELDASDGTLRRTLMKPARSD